MQFHRLDFFVFFAVVAAVYALLRHRAQNLWLLAASYVFYGYWDWRFTGLLALSTIVDFVAGQRISDAASPRAKSLWLTLSIATNLGILGAFKYFGFFVGSATALLETLGLQADAPTLMILLPAGISFYTFQSMSYTIDIYRGRTRPAGRGLRALSDFALYVAFFPQLIAGPIERSTHLLPQILQPRTLSWQGLTRGTWLFFLGLVLKMGIADEIATQVDHVYADLARHSLAGIYRGTLGFALQIYCDFAGYSLMARGAAHMLGFELMVNFRQPFLSSSFADFWRRWNVSLSTWFRDYLYIPLGGSRRGTLGTLFAVVVTMALAGLWHGTTWAFVLWGLLHAALLITERLPVWRPITSRIRERAVLAVPARLAYGLVVFHGILLAMVLFRVGDIGQLVQIGVELAEGGLRLGSLWDLPLTLPNAGPFAKFAAIFVLLEIPAWWQDRELRPRDLSLPHRAALYVVMVLILLSSSGNADAPFIYFQF